MPKVLIVVISFNNEKTLKNTWAKPVWTAGCMDLFAILGGKYWKKRKLRRTATFSRFLAIQRAINWINKEYKLPCFVHTITYNKNMIIEMFESQNIFRALFLTSSDSEGFTISIYRSHISSLSLSFILEEFSDLKFLKRKGMMKRKLTVNYWISNDPYVSPQIQRTKWRRQNLNAQF